MEFCIHIIYIYMYIYCICIYIYYVYVCIYIYIYVTFWICVLAATTGCHKKNHTAGTNPAIKLICLS